jgi:hypothetical protein
VEDARRCLAPGGSWRSRPRADAEARRRIDATPGLEFLSGWRDLAGVVLGVLALADGREA